MTTTKPKKRKKAKPATPALALKSHQDRPFVPVAASTPQAPINPAQQALMARHREAEWHFEDFKFNLLLGFAAVLTGLVVGAVLRRLINESD